jgi:hypothetical protein
MQEAARGQRPELADLGLPLAAPSDARCRIEFRFRQFISARGFLVPRDKSSS